MPTQTKRPTVPHDADSPTPRAAKSARGRAAMDGVTVGQPDQRDVEAQAEGSAASGRPPSRRRDANSTDGGDNGSRDVRRALVDASLELFYERGFEATGVQDIVERAGCTKGALYHYFRSKDDLLLQIHNDWWAPLLEEGRAIQDRSLTATEGLNSIIRQLMLEVKNRRAQFTVAFLETRVDRSQYPEARVPGEEWRAILAEIIDRGRRDGEFRPDLRSTKVLVYGLVGMCVWAAFHWFPEESDLAAEEVGDVFAELMLRGIGLSEPST